MDVAISVVMPIYNGEKQISHAIESVLQQTMGDIELICVDDCSTDSTARIVKAYGKRDLRVKLMQHTHNRGPLMARQTGTGAACGKYIMYLDADDAYAPEACEILLKAMQDTGADMIHFGTTYQKENKLNKDLEAIFDRDASDAGMWSGAKAGVDLLERYFILKTLHWSIWNKIVESNLAKRIYKLFGEARCDIAEDALATFFLLVHAKRVWYVTHKLYFYRVGVGITADHSVARARMVATEYHVYQVLCQHLTEKQKQDKRIAHALAALHNELLDAVMWNLMHIEEREALDAFTQTLSKYMKRSDFLDEVRGYCARVAAKHASQIHDLSDELCHFADVEAELAAQIRALNDELTRASIQWTENEAHYIRDIRILKDHIEAQEQASVQEHEAWRKNEEHYQNDILQLKTQLQEAQVERELFMRELDLERRKGVIEHMKTKWNLERGKFPE